MDFLIHENKSSSMGFFRHLWPRKVNKKVGNQNYLLPTKLTFANCLEYTWQVDTQYIFSRFIGSSRPIIQLNNQTKFRNFSN